MVNTAKVSQSTPVINQTHEDKVNETQKNMMNRNEEGIKDVCAEVF